MKKWLIILVIGILLISTTIASATEFVTVTSFPVQLVINGIQQQIPPDSILNYNNSTYVPLRFIAENLGAKVGYDEKPTDEDPKVTIDLPNQNRQEWKLFYFQRGGASDGMPFDLQISRDVKTVDDKSFTIGARIYSRSDKPLIITKAFSFDVEIIKIEGDNEKQIWSGQFQHLPERTEFPGTNNRDFFGYEYESFEWDSKGNSVLPPGEYLIRLALPATIEYTIDGGNNENLTQHFLQNTTQTVSEFTIRD